MRGVSERTSNDRPRARLVRAGTMPLVVGVLTWFVGLATAFPAMLQVGRSFMSAGLGVLAAAAVRTLWEQRHDRLHPAAQLGTFLAVALVTYVAFGEVAGFTGI